MRAGVGELPPNMKFAQMKTALNRCEPVPNFDALPTVVSQGLAHWAAHAFIPAGVKTWVFKKGMEYGARDCWWGACKLRQNPHEGIDLAVYKGEAGDELAVKAGTEVTAPMSGTVAAVFADFLAFTVVVFHTIFGHINPSEQVQSGFPDLKESDV
eukprot:gene4165-5144_t